MQVSDRETRYSRENFHRKQSNRVKSFYLSIRKKKRTIQPRRRAIDLSKKIFSKSDSQAKGANRRRARAGRARGGRRRDRRAAAVAGGRGSRRDKLNGEKRRPQRQTRFHFFHNQARDGERTGQPAGRRGGKRARSTEGRTATAPRRGGRRIGHQNRKSAARAAQTDRPRRPRRAAGTTQHRKNANCAPARN